ncbi:hypothetical protein PMALA_037350 [Plasmodium malariae]|uniref:Uncharacterized protein n=1 Tax=Plasmodium malariae TaxID=5858 RepID=A0A1A8WLQ5_PLAMA|nr:hypothetical protein PMALA_037350 [Plasmodium malariae]
MLTNDLFISDSNYSTILSEFFEDINDLNKSLLRMIKITQSKFKKIEKSKSRLRDKCYLLAYALGLHIIKIGTPITMKYAFQQMKMYFRKVGRAKDKNLQYIKLLFSP